VGTRLKRPLLVALARRSAVCKPAKSCTFEGATIPGADAQRPAAGHTHTHVSGGHLFAALGKMLRGAPRDAARMRTLAVTGLPALLSGVHPQPSTLNPKP